MAKKPTHTVTLRVQVCGPEEFSEVYQSFCLVANGLGLRYNDVAVQSYIVEEWDEDEEEKEEATAKIRVALRELDFSEGDINQVISVLVGSGLASPERS